MYIATATPICATYTKSVAHTLLMRSAALWFVVTLIGQLAFFVFISAFYALPALAGNVESWARNTMLLKGYVAGDSAGNLQFAAHMLLAAVVTFSGVLQLLPAMRCAAPAFHRWNGRVFMVAALTAALGGLGLTWIRQTMANPISGIAISLNAALIVVFAALAWRCARVRDFAAHRRWAMRTFMVVSGVWFMRLGYLAWFLINQGPAGVTRKMDGPFDVFLAFASYLLPLAVLELYLRASASNRAAFKWATAGVIIVATLLMCIGVFGTSRFMWWPLLLKLAS
jgi:Predicted membrane protein (DUF2306)